MRLFVSWIAYKKKTVPVLIGKPLKKSREALFLREFNKWNRDEYPSPRFFFDKVIIPSLAKERLEGCSYHAFFVWAKEEGLDFPQPSSNRFKNMTTSIKAREAIFEEVYQKWIASPSY